MQLSEGQNTRKTPLTERKEPDETTEKRITSCIMSPAGCIKTPLGRNVAFVVELHGGSSSPACRRLYPAPALKQQAVRWAGSAPQQTDVGLKLQDRVETLVHLLGEAVPESLWHEMSRFQSSLCRQRTENYRETRFGSSLFLLAASAGGMRKKCSVKVVLNMVEKVRRPYFGVKDDSL